MNKDYTGLKLLAEVISEEMEEEIKNIESVEVEIPEELHLHMLEFAKDLDKREFIRRKKQIHTRILRFAAIFCICLVTASGISLGTSDALRERIFSIFHNESNGSITLRNQSEYDMIGNWNDYWYPTWIPEGYYLLGADKNARVMLYVSDTTSTEIRILESNSTTDQSYDKDTTIVKPINIHHYQGYLFVDNENCSIDLVWTTENRILKIDIQHSTDATMALTIAENLKYIVKN